MNMNGAKQTSWYMIRKCIIIPWRAAKGKKNKTKANRKEAKLDRKGCQKGTKGSQRDPKGSQMGDKMESKGSQREAVGAKWEPKGCQNEARGAKRMLNHVKVIVWSFILPESAAGSIEMDFWYDWIWNKTRLNYLCNEGAVNDSDVAATLGLGLHRRSDLVTLLDFLSRVDLLTRVDNLTRPDFVPRIDNLTRIKNPTRVHHLDQTP